MLPKRRRSSPIGKKSQNTSVNGSPEASTPWESRQIVGVDPHEIYNGKSHNGKIQNGQADHGSPGHGHATPPPPPTCSGVLHQVKKGDTLYKLAVANCLTLEAIIAANPQIKDPNRLVIGQLVCIPQGSDSMMEIFNTLLTAEKIEVAMYAEGLKCGVLECLPPEEYAYIQAALSHEMAHANTLESLGASVPYNEFYYPPKTFEDPDVFLRTILMIETTGVAAYTQASIEFARMGRLDLARLADRIMGVEAEHRTLLRSVLDLIPANDLCFEDAPNKPVSEILASLPNFLLPHQFNGKSVGPIAMPSAATVDKLVGPHGCPDPTP